MKQSRNIFIVAGHRGGNTGAVVNDKSEALETIRVREWISEGLKAKGIIAINDNDNASLNKESSRSDEKRRDYIIPHRHDMGHRLRRHKQRRRGKDLQAEATRRPQGNDLPRGL